MLTVYHRDTVRVAPSIVVRMAGRDILCGSWEFAPKRNGSAWQLFTPSALPEVLSLETEQRIAYAERVLALLARLVEGSRPCLCGGREDQFRHGLDQQTSGHAAWGAKQSGIGVEKGQEGLEEFTQAKIINMAK
jgi:hypothetical protein